MAAGGVKASRPSGRVGSKASKTGRKLNYYIVLLSPEALPSRAKRPGPALRLHSSTGKTMNFNVQDLMFFVPMILIIYFMIFLPKRREQQALTKMFEALKKGDRVLTHSGMYGEVAAIKDNLITLKFHDGVRIDFNKTAIARAVEDKAEAKA